MRRFWRFLLRKSLPPDSLAATRYAVFGLGDSGYPQFNVRDATVGVWCCGWGCYAQANETTPCIAIFLTADTCGLGGLGRPQLPVPSDGWYTLCWVAGAWCGLSIWGQCAPPATRDLQICRTNTTPRQVVAKKLDRRLEGLGAAPLVERGLGDDQVRVAHSSSAHCTLHIGMA